MTAPKLYRASTVCEVASIKPVTLRQWHLRNVIQPEADELPELLELATDEAVVRALNLRPNITPEVVEAVRSVQNAGRMGWRLYLDTDIVRVVVLTRLLRHGIEPHRAGLIAKHCQVGQPLPNPKKVYITTDGKEIKPQPRPAPAGKDHFAIVFESERRVPNFQLGKRGGLVGRAQFVPFLWHRESTNLEIIRSEVADRIFGHFTADSFLVLNLSAIERQVREKLSKIAEPQESTWEG